MIPKLKDIQDYFETVATRNVDLRHGINNRKTFYRISGDESGAITTNAASPRIQIEHYGGRFTGAAEALEKPVNLTFEILSKADATEAGKQAAYEEAETVMDDIIAFLAEESLVQAECYLLKGIMFSSINFDKIGPKGQNEFGYRVTIAIRHYAAPYNPQKWM